ncbi:MAG: ABC transporter substrate-binding protein [Chloroflexi bacterium]|nr:ABC transporter substrate-binding protein [Chloroflexota bacterium]
MATPHSRQPLRLMEVFRTVFYTPIYVSVAGGFLESEGLDVTFTTCPPEFGQVHRALIQGAADISGSGIMRSIITLDMGAETVPAHVAEINARDGFFVLGRQPQNQFQWQALKGATVIPVGFSPMPWASFQFALRNNGVEPGELKLISGLTLDEALSAFKGGQGDFIHLPQPAAEQLIASGAAHLAVALGPANGHIAYSSFAATNRFLDQNPDVVHRFIRGYARALNWLSDNDPAAVGQAISPFFPGVDSELITKAVERYKSQETWPRDPQLEEPEYQNLQEILIAAGMVQERQPYSKVVRPEFARDALK